MLAETALLTAAQQKFRRAAKSRLNHALPVEVWLDHKYSVLPGERGRPVATHRSERWYSYAQVVLRGVNPRSRRRVVILNGGSMATVHRGRR